MAESGKQQQQQQPRGRHAGMFRTGKPKETRKTLKRLYRYIERSRIKLLIAFVCVLVNTVAMLAGTYMLRPVVNMLTGGGSRQDLLRMILLMACVYGVGVFAQYLQAKIMIGISMDTLERLRNDLFAKIQRLPVRYFDRNSHGDLMSRFTNDVDTLGELFSVTIMQLLSGAVTITGTLALMLYTNVWLTLVTVVMIPVMLKAGGFVAKISRTSYAGQQEALGALNGFIEETVAGQKVVKVFCHEEQAIADFDAYNKSLKKQQMKAQFFGGIMGPVMFNIGQINYALTAMVGGVLAVLRGFDIGGLTVFVNYSRQFSRPINEFSMQMNTVFSALAGAERVFAIMDEPEEETENALSLHLKETESGVEWVVPKDNERYRFKSEHPQFHPEVVLQNVFFGYVPEKTILKHITLYAKPGQKIAFVGSTGAGKTTITNLLNRFYEIGKGAITIDGVEIGDIAADDLRRNVAMVLQDTHLFAGTVRENIRYGRLDATDEEVVDAAKTASAHSFIMRLKDGYDTVLTEDGANLSQGQRQLLNIARAAISKAPILILDEATSSVDTRTEKHIEKGMDRLMAERTTFVIAHRLSTVRNADAIMVLENGEIIERGDHDKLLELKGRYYELYTGMATLA